MLLHMFFFIPYCCVILIMESIIFTECMLLWAEEKWYCKFFLRFGRRRHDICTLYHKVVLNTYFISYTVLYSCVLVFVLVFSLVLISLHDFDFTEEEADKHSAAEPQRLVCVDCRRVVHDGHRLCHCVWCRYRNDQETKLIFIYLRNWEKV